MHIKLFSRDNCPRCPAAKKFITNLKLDFEEFDVDTVDGLAEASYHEVLATPSIIVVNDGDNEIAGWHGTVPHKDEFMRSIGHEV